MISSNASRRKLESCLLSTKKQPCLPGKSKQQSVLCSLGSSPSMRSVKEPRQLRSSLRLPRHWLSTVVVPNKPVFFKTTQSIKVEHANLNHSSFCLLAEVIPLVMQQSDHHICMKYENSKPCQQVVLYQVVQLSSMDLPGRQPMCAVAPVVRYRHPLPFLCSLEASTAALVVRLPAVQAICKILLLLGRLKGTSICMVLW